MQRLDDLRRGVNVADCAWSKCYVFKFSFTSFYSFYTDILNFKFMELDALDTNFEDVISLYGSRFSVNTAPRHMERRCIRYV